MKGILNRINSSKDIKKLGLAELNMLADEIRDYIIDTVSKNGGHLASNLGSVELTLAINRVYNPEIDRILFDVGHQCYTHKIINGRKESFTTLRTFNGIAGFPRPYEDNSDSFIAGHSSDSVSVGLGMAKARTLLKQDYDVCVVIGDGSLTGGLAYEGLETAAQSKEPMVIILNDNGMSISKNVGGISKTLQKLRVSPDYINFKRNYRNFVGLDSKVYRISHNVKEIAKSKILQGNIFSELGLHYLGPIDGHNINDLTIALQWAKELKKPVLLHVVTQKGKGCSYAEMHPNVYHGVGPFDPVSGDIKNKSDGFGDYMGRFLSDLANDDDKIVAITAAMSDGTGLNHFISRHPDRFLDVGITEGNAVAVAAGMAKQGLKPVFAVYSTFLQRGYDMLIHDVSLQNLHVVLCVDRAGLVGSDGETHQGTFDLAYLSTIPNMKIFAPASIEELRIILDEALNTYNCPVAIRYPRGGEETYSDLNIGNCVIKSGDDITLVSYGIMINEVVQAEKILRNKGINCEIIKVTDLTGDYSVIADSVSKTGKLIVTEDVCSEGSVGNKILIECEKKGLIMKYNLLNCGNGIVQHGSVKQLRSLCNIDSQAIIKSALDMYE